MMIIECETTRIIHKNENFQLVGCIPIGEYNNLATNPRYGTITIKDTGHRLVENKRYKIAIEPLPPNKYGQQYMLLDIPSLSFNEIEDITDEMELELLEQVMSEQQAKYVHEAYPNFVKLVLNGNESQIKVNDIYNVSDKRLAQYIKKVGSRYNTFLLQGNMKQYKLTAQECTNMLNTFGNIERVTEAFKENPYYCLISICGRSFRSADVIILSHDKTWKYTQERIEYMIDGVLRYFEITGSTCVDAIEIGKYIYNIDIDVVDKLKNVAVESKIIVYDSKRNILQRREMYEKEYEIAAFFKDKLHNSTPLDWDWEKYKTIKDGTLTAEQQNVLKAFCQHNILILDAPSGTGKTSSLMALIQMIEDNGLTYKLMSPTGKAASRLSEQTGRDASTIHRATLSNSLYDADVIIIDEASMLSVDLMHMVISCELLSNCRILLVGDSAQIPSIGAGRVFKDLREGGVPTCTLTKCFRFDEGGASYISTLTRQGKFYFTDKQKESDHFTIGEKQDYEFIKFNNTVEQIVDTYMSLINEGVEPKDIMLLVPYNVGSYGATTINNLIQEKINPVGTQKFLGTKHNDIQVRIHPNDLVMNIKNNYNAMTWQNYDNALWEESPTLEDVEKTAVYNGQTGYVKSLKYDKDIINGNILIVDIEGEDIIYTTGDINNLLLAYASNPYKFQGSQCKYIINVVIPAHEYVWNRQLLYTAQTRMTTKLIEIGDPDVIKKAINTMGDDNRLTRIKEFLCAS